MNLPQIYSNQSVQTSQRWSREIVPPPPLLPNSNYIQIQELKFKIYVTIEFWMAPDTIINNQQNMINILIRLKLYQ